MEPDARLAGPQRQLLLQMKGNDLYDSGSERTRDHKSDCCQEAFQTTCKPAFKNLSILLQLRRQHPRLELRARTSEGRTPYGLTQEPRPRAAARH